jgi:hypothetical protein
VDAAGSNDYPHDMPGTAARTIPGALALAEDGTTIAVLPGLYDSAAGTVLSKQITLRGATRDPGDVTYRRTAGEYHVVLDNPLAKVENMTLTNGAHYGNVYVQQNGGTLSNCVLTAGNSGGDTPLCAGGLYMTGPGLVTHCVIADNTCGNYGGQVNVGGVRMIAGRLENSLVKNNRGPAVTDSPTATYIGGVHMNGGTVASCTIAGNTDNVGGVHNNAYGGVYVQAGSVLNSVIAGNGTNRLGNVASASAFNHCTLDFDLPGTVDCVVSTPDVIFLNAAGGDYHLGPASPAIDAGPRVGPEVVATAGTDLDGKPRIQNNRLDNGCYETNTRGTLFLLK